MITGIEMKTNDILVGVVSAYTNKKQRVMEAFDKAIVSYDAWFLVLLAVIMTLAVVVATGLAIWCTVYKGKKFTGKWNWSKNGVSVSTECK